MCIKWPSLTRLQKSGNCLNKFGNNAEPNCEIVITSGQQTGESRETDISRRCSFRPSRGTRSGTRPQIENFTWKSPEGEDSIARVNI